MGRSLARGNIIFGLLHISCCVMLTSWKQLGVSACIPPGRIYDFIVSNQYVDGRLHPSAAGKRAARVKMTFLSRAHDRFLSIPESSNKTGRQPCRIRRCSREYTFLCSLKTSFFTSPVRADSCSGCGRYRTLTLSDV